MRPYVWMVAGAFSFALMGAFAHALRTRADWTVIALVRVAVPLVLSGLAATIAGVELVFWKPRSLWTRSLAGSVSLICAFFALTHLPVSIAFTLTNLYPLWVALLSWPLLGQSPTAGVWVAIVTGIAGVALIQQPQSGTADIALLAALASSISAAVAMIGLHRLHRIDVRAIVFHFSAVAFVFCVAATALTHRTLPLDLQASTLLMLLGTGLSATLGQLFLTLAFAAGPPNRVAVAGLTQVVFGLMFDVLIWDRRLGWLSLAGIVLITVPTAWLLGTRSAPAAASPAPDEAATTTGQKCIGADPL